MPAVSFNRTFRVCSWTLADRRDQSLMSQLCDQEVRLAADSAGAGLERLLPMPVSLLEQSDDGCTGAVVREPAYRLGKCLAVETRAGKNGLDPLPRKDLRGVGQRGDRPDLEAGTTPLDGADRDRALVRITIRKEKPRCRFVPGEDVNVVGRS